MCSVGRGEVCHTVADFVNGLSFYTLTRTLPSSILSAPKIGRASDARLLCLFLPAAGVQARNLLQPVLQPG